MPKKKENEKHDALEFEKELLTDLVKEDSPFDWKESINISKDDHEVNDHLTAWLIFGNRPSKLTIYSSFDESLWDILNDEYGLEESKIHKITEIIPSGEEIISN